MRRYSASGRTAAGTNLTIGEVIANTTVRGRIYEWAASSPTAPADVATEFNIIRGTVSGTGTGSVTARLIDPADTAALLTFKQGTFSGQTKTATSSLYEISLNQRASYRWVAVPDAELIIPATSDNWVGLESIGSTATPIINFTVYWQE